MTGLVKALNTHLPSRDVYADIDDETLQRDGNKEVADNLKKMERDWNKDVADNLEKMVDAVR